MTKNKIIAMLGTAALALSLTACGNTQTKDAEVSTANSSVQVVTGATKVSTGNFSGRSDHVTTGLVTLEKTVNGYQLNFAADFFLDGAPDPVVAVGNNDTFLVSNKLGALKNRTGAQIYPLPANFTPGQFSQVYVWCEQFSVPLGIADLTGT